MAYIVRMPKLGVEMEEGVVLEWHASEGDRVEEGDLIAEIESEKTQAEVAAREDGVLRRIVLDVDEAGEPGAAMGIVAGPDESIDNLLAEADAEPAPESGDESGEASATGEPARSGGAGDAPASAEASAATPEPEEVQATPKAKAQARELGVDPATVEGTGPKGSVTAADVERAAGAGETGGEGRPSPGDAGGPATTPDAGDADVSPGEIPSAEGVKASPRARKRAAELGVDVSGVEGTGPEGSVVAADVRRSAAAGGATGTTAASTGSTAPSATGTAGRGTTRTIREEREQSRMRKTIARRLGQSWREAPHVTVDRRVDAEALFAAVEAAEASGHDVSITDVLLRAVSETLSEHPSFNATFEDGIHTVYEEHNVGVAIDVDDGLITPVVPDVGNKTVDEIATARAELTERALSGDFTGDDLSGGTFTVSNLGVFGVDSFTPIINPPEVAILGVNDVEERPVKGARGGIEFRRHIGFSLSFDHRVVDGADAARFLDTLAETLQDAVALVP